MVGEHARKLLDNADQIIPEFEIALLEVRQTSISAGISGVADESDIREECSWFLLLLCHYNIVFSILRSLDRVSCDDMSALRVSLDKVAELWATSQCGESKAYSFTPKMHCLLVHVPRQLQYLGRYGHFLEDPIERLHKDDKHKDRIFACMREYVTKEESKQK